MNLRWSLFLTIIFLSACVQHDLDPQEVNCATTDLSISLIKAVNASACSAADGSVHFQATGGQAPYLFQLNSIESDDGVFTGLRSGGYSVTVTDSRSCTARVANIIISADGFSFSAAVIEDTDCTNGNGSVMISVSDGMPPYEYEFRDEGYSENSHFTSLEAETYSIGVRDSQGCSARLEVSVPKGVTGTSWENSIRPMITSHCSVSGCHNGISRPDLRVYTKAKQYAAQIKALTADRSMPFEGSLTQDQIDLFRCWVDEGALQN